MRWISRQELIVVKELIAVIFVTGPFYIHKVFRNRQVATHSGRSAVARC